MEHRRKKKKNKIKETNEGISENYNGNTIQGKKRKIFISKRNLNNIILLIYLYIIFFNCAIQEKLRKLEMISKIHLQINGTGNQDVLSSSFSPIPDQIIVNGITQNDTNKKVAKNLVQNINNVTLIWNSFSSECCNSMFKDLINITKIDMSEFKPFSVNNMQYMFSGCESLKELNLNNLNTYSVTHMNHMFFNCKSLTTLNLSSFQTSNLLYTY